MDPVRTIPFEGGFFRGQTHEGIPHGVGVVAWPVPRPGSAAHYEGEFRHGQKHGTGVLSLWNGTRYEGTFREGLRNGSGVSLFADGTRLAGDLQERSGAGRCVLECNVGRYVGEWRDGAPHGLGVNEFSGAGVYEGCHALGARAGAGAFVWATGDAFEGGYAADVRHGTGTYTWPDGAVYSGAFANGCRHGLGIFAWPSGDTFEGTYCMDRRDGFGTFTNAVDASVDAGRWRGAWLVHLEPSDEVLLTMCAGRVTPSTGVQKGWRTLAAKEFLQATADGRLDDVQRHVQSGRVFPDVADGAGHSAVLLAALHGHLPLVSWLLQCALLDANMPADDGKTPLLAVCQLWASSADGSTDAATRQPMIDMLLAHKANPNVHCASVPPPLHLACHRRVLSLVVTLLSHGAQPDWAGCSPHHPLPSATSVLLHSLLHAQNAGTLTDHDMQEARSILLHLLDAGAAVNAVDSRGWQPLQLVTLLTSALAALLAKLLLQRGALPGDVGPPPDGDHALGLAIAARAHPRLVAVLLQHGASPSVACMGGLHPTALHLLLACAQPGDPLPGLLALLLAHDIPVTVHGCIVQQLEAAPAFLAANEVAREGMRAALRVSVRKQAVEHRAKVCLECGRASVALSACPLCGKVYFCSERCKRAAQSTHHLCAAHKGGQVALSGKKWNPGGVPLSLDRCEPRATMTHQPQVSVAPIPRVVSRKMSSVKLGRKAM